MNGQSGLAGRVWAIGIGLLLAVAIVAGLGGYELGLRASRPGSLAASTSPAPTASSPTASSTTPASSASPSPAPAGYPSLNGAPVIATSLNCRLPVYRPGTNGSGAFLQFPQGTVTPDSSSRVFASGSSMGGGDDGDWFGLTFTSGRWLPVPYPWVGQGGTYYAYAMDFNRHAGVNTLLEVNVQTGSSAVLQPAAPINGGWQVVAFSSTYIYAIYPPSPSSPTRPGLYSVPLSGPWNNENYISDGFWFTASGFYAFGSTTLDGGSIVREDVRNQTRVSWFTKASALRIIGVDGAGNPVIWTGTDLWIASGPNQATQIGTTAPLAVASQQQGVPGVQSPVADSHGLWLSLADGIYLYADGKLTKVSNLIAQVAGACA